MRVFAEYDGPMCFWPRVMAMPHAIEVLEELRVTWRLALATNAADSDVGQIEAALARVGLDRLIDRIYCYRLTGYRKPSRAFFEQILADLQIPGSMAVMVGDDYENDALGAIRAGIPAVWLNHADKERREGDMLRTIFSLSELPAVLKQLVGDDS
jgi:FMN phosphatase YigB (HAD superfamily)